MKVPPDVLGNRSLRSLVAASNQAVPSAHALRQRSSFTIKRAARRPKGPPDLLMASIIYSRKREHFYLKTVNSNIKEATGSARYFKHAQVCLKRRVAWSLERSFLPLACVQPTCLLPGMTEFRNRKVGWSQVQSALCITHHYVKFTTDFRRFAC